MVDGIGALGYNKSVGNEPRQEYQMNIDIATFRTLTLQAQSNVTNAIAARRPAAEVRTLKTIRDNLERAYVAAQALAK